MVNYLRVRGEYLVALLRTYPTLELPPRTRRIPLVNLGHARPGGTTSAYAENTAQTHQPHHRRRNYLRVRGEYQSRAITGWDLWELPPRTRRIPDSVAI